jgi:WD40 repeat protein
VLEATPHSRRARRPSPSPPAASGSGTPPPSTLERVATTEDAHHKIANGCAGLGGEVFASVSRDLLLRIWGTDREPLEVVTPHTHSIKCVNASSDGRYVATGSYNGRIAVYDRAASEWTAVQRPTTAGISSLAYDDERGCFLASSYDGRVYLVNE